MRRKRSTRRDANIEICTLEPPECICRTTAAGESFHLMCKQDIAKRWLKSSFIGARNHENKLPRIGQITDKLVHFATLWQLWSSGDRETVELGTNRKLPIQVRKILRFLENLIRDFELSAVLDDFGL